MFTVGGAEVIGKQYASAVMAAWPASVAVHHLREANDCGLALPPGRAVVEEARSSACDFPGTWWRGKAGPGPCAGCSACCYCAGVPVDKKRDRSRLPHLLTERNHYGVLVLQRRAGIIRGWCACSSISPGTRSRPDLADSAACPQQ